MNLYEMSITLSDGVIDIDLSIIHNSFVRNLALGCSTD